MEHNPLNLPFSLSAFIEKVDNHKEKVGEDQIKFNQLTVATYKKVIEADDVTPELLDSLTLEELEWVLDMLSYWPSFDSDFMEQDATHTGFQFVSIQQGITEISRIPSTVKKKVTFI